MAAGKYLDRIVVRRPAVTDDGFSAEVPSTPSDILTVWADMLETTGRERIAAGGIGAVRKATIRVRQTPDTLAIEPTDLIFARGAVWSIDGFARIGRRSDILEITCTTGQA